MSAQELPVKTGDDFIGELEVMDLSALKDQTFLVAVSQGDRNKGRFLSTTVRGPYSFVEMVEEVGTMWQQHQHHAKVVICTKKRTSAIKTLDENTSDYIEAHYSDIIIESMLDGAFDEDKEFTCRAGIVEGDLSDEPAKPAQKPNETDDDDDL